jgi:hypothetical protein
MVFRVNYYLVSQIAEFTVNAHGRGNGSVALST